jgi:hypothetical protein
LLSLTFRVKRPALVKKFTGISSPGVGTVLNAGNPGTVTTFPAGVELVANVGRWLNCELPRRSWLSVTLYGIPEVAIRKGLNRNPWGRATEASKKKRLRISKEARP